MSQIHNVFCVLKKKITFSRIRHWQGCGWKVSITQNHIKTSLPFSLPWFYFHFSHLTRMTPKPQQRSIYCLYSRIVSCVQQVLKNMFVEISRWGNSGKEHIDSIYIWNNSNFWSGMNSIQVVVQWGTMIKEKRNCCQERKR